MVEEDDRTPALTTNSQGHMQEYAKWVYMFVSKPHVLTASVEAAILITILSSDPVPHVIHSLISPPSLLLFCLCSFQAACSSLGIRFCAAAWSVFVAKPDHCALFVA